MSSRRQLTKHKVDHLGFNTEAEKIIGYLDGSLPKSQLNAKMVEKLDRIVQAKAWLFEYKFQTKVVEMMINHFNYSEVTAYRDLRLMERVFGPLLRMNKDLKRALADEMIRQDRELAIAKKDTKALGANKPKTLAQIEPCYPGGLFLFNAYDNGQSPKVFRI